MTRARTRIPLMDHWNPNTRQRRTHRFLDTVRESIARLMLSPIGDGALPHVLYCDRDLEPLADQAITLYGENFLQDALKAELTTDDGTLNTEINWEAVLPGKDGNDLTLTITDTGALTVAAVADDIAITINLGVTTAAQVVAAVLADATVREMIRGTATGTGAGTPTEMAETSFSGGSGEGDYAVEPSGVPAILRWTDTEIDLVLDLSSYSDGQAVDLMVIADGIEERITLGMAAAGSSPSAGRGGIGCLLLAGDTAAGESFDIGTETWTFVVGAPAAQFEVTESLAGGAAVAAANIVAALNDAAFGSDLVSAHVVAGSNCVALVPLDVTGIAGNYVLDAALTAQMTDQDMQSGAADAFQGAYPLTYVITAEDVTRWAAGEFRPVACYPFTDQPNLISMLFVRPNGAAYDEIGSTFTNRVRFAASDNGYWVMELLDPAPPDFQADDELRMVIGQ